MLTNGEDRLFTAPRQGRLSELMRLWREARDRGEALPADQLAELEALTEAELNAAGDRAGRITHELG